MSEWAPKEGDEITYPGDVYHVFVDSPDTMGCSSCGEAYDHKCHAFLEGDKI